MTKIKLMARMVLALVLISPALSGWAAMSKMIQGTVLNAGADDLVLIAESGEHLEITVPASTRVIRDGQAAKLEQLQTRDQVSVAASGAANGHLVATDIFARSPY